MSATSIGQPSLTITWEAAAETVVSRLKNGIVAVFVRDASVEAVSITSTRSVSEIPSTLGADNVAYATRAYEGSERGNPSRVLLVALPPESTDDDEETDYFGEALSLLYYHEADYVVPPLDVTSDELETFVLWIQAQREEYRTFKGLVPNTAADDRGIINVSMDDTVTADGTLDSIDMCPRIAGILAGLPISAAVTSVPVDEVTGVPTLSKTVADALVASGKLFLQHDGRYARVSRGVNSLTTVPTTGNESWCKIKITEAMDLITYYGRAAFDDACGAMVNTYDNKQILVGGFLSYFADLEAAGCLNSGYTCQVNATAQEAYLKEQGVDTSDMSDNDILQANTGTWVFINYLVSVLDAMEDFDFAGQTATN